MSQRLFSCIVALITAAITGATGILAHEKLVSDDAATNALLDHLKLGGNRFVFTTKNDPDRCFGEAVVNLTDEDQSFHIKVVGWANFEFEDKTFNQNVTGDLSFNPLGQMGSSLFHMNAGPNDVRFGTMNINPITAIVAVEGAPVQQQLRQNIPGPVEIARASDGTYRLNGPIITKSLPISNQTFGLLLGTEVKILRDEGVHCEKATAQSLNLSGLSSVMGAFRSRLSSLIPTFGL